MEDYRKILRKRKILCLVFGILLLPLAIATLYLFYSMDSAIKGSDIVEFFGGVLNGLRAGLGITIVMLLFVKAIQYHKALKNDTEIKNLYIEEHDERNIALNEKSSKISFNVIFLAIFISCVITGFINSTVSLTLLAVLFFVTLTKVVIYIMYSRKM